MKIKPTILFLVQLPPPIHGAAIVNSQVIDNKLLKDAFDIKVVPFDFVKDNTEIGKLSLYKFLIFFIIYLKVFFSIIFHRPKLVFFNLSFKGGAFYRDLVYISLLKSFRINIVYFIQGKGISEILKTKKWMKILYKFTFNNSSVICLSKLLMSDIESVYKEVPYVVNNGIKAVCIVKNEKKESESVVLIYLSSLAKDKGLLVLLDTIKVLKERNLNFTLKVVGGPLTLSYEEIIEYIKINDLISHVDLIGPKYGEEKYNELQASDIFIFPTLNEAFGLVNLEAMQCSLPVISTFEGAIPEIIDDGITGFLVEKNNSIQLADKIEVLINNPDLRKQMGEAGRKKFLEKYTLEVFEQNMKNVFDDILKKSK